MVEPKASKRKRHAHDDGSEYQLQASKTGKTDLKLPALLSSNLDADFNEETLSSISTTVDSGRLHLLGLAAELLNYIMDLVLLEDEPIFVVSSMPVQPGVLQVCQQLRDGYIGIYYTDNIFVFDVASYNIKPVVPPYALISRYLKITPPRFGYVSSVCDLSLFGRPNWENLKEWARLVHARRLSAPTSSAACSPQELSALDVLGAAKNLRMLKWKDAEKVLENMHSAIASFDSDWL